MSNTRKSSTLTTLKESQNVALTYQPVRAVGNDNWVVQADTGKVLDGVYMDYDTLCCVRPGWGQNQMSAAMSVYAKQKHIKPMGTEKRVLFGRFETTNQKRIATILVSKCLHERTTDAPFQGAVCLASSEAADEE